MDVFKKIIFLAVVFLTLLSATSVLATTAGETVTFNVDQRFDETLRSQVPATLVKVSGGLYIYVEKGWWDSQNTAKQSEILINLEALSREFRDNIRPSLTNTFGSEWTPGIDNDANITVLFHAMKEDAGGYFRSGDEYEKIQVPNSNQREMVYLPLAQIEKPQVKVVLAHEFTHLIEFNQKDRLQGVAEDTWLNEARADYTSTLLGYDNTYEGSNLQRRARNFLEKPADSLTEWQETKYDYAMAAMVTHYLVERYGVAMLTDSLKLKSVGIASLNEALANSGAKENFSRVFANWAVAVVLNNCQIGAQYCYTNSNLQQIHVIPVLNFLSISGNTSLTVSGATKDWAGDWQKVIGGKGNLTLELSGFKGMQAQIPYILVDKQGVISVDFMPTTTGEKRVLQVKDFGINYSSLVIMPLLQSKVTGFGSSESLRPYSFTVSVSDIFLDDDDVLIDKLSAQIESLQQQIAQIRAKKSSNCSVFTVNLYLGIQNSNQVRCLQEFLKKQGVDIYPEGLVTGNFGALTKAAVVRFQEKYKSEVLTPGGFSMGTGFVGPLTRAKINALMK